jgi:hypothetical protein
MKIYLTFLFILLINISASANDCSNIDLRNENLGIARNQGKVSWCYAFASSDFLNFYNPGETPSAAAVASLYNTHKLPQTMYSFINWYHQITNNPKARLPFQTGLSKIAIELSLKEGLCHESEFPSTKWKKVGISSNFEKEEHLDQVMHDIWDMKQKTTKGLSLDMIGFSYELPNVTKEEFYEVVKNYKINEIFNVLRIHSCSHRSLNPMKLKMSFKKKTILGELNFKLDQYEPVLLDYSSEILEDRHFKKPIGSLHTSLIVGRRFNDQKNRCEYLIKNSYGESCIGYDSDYHCEKGFIWLPEQELYRSMTSIVYSKN